MNQKVAFIGGSGLYKMDSLELIEEIEVDTPFGKPSSKIMKFNKEGKEFFFLARHGIGHVFLPSEVNYRANIYALKSLGVEVIISVSAVGSLKEEHAPTMFVLPDQFIDWTKGFRARSFFGEGMVGHVSNAHPVNNKLQDLIESSLKDTNIKYSRGGTYICIEGPQFSTRSESLLYKDMNCDVIGMTNVPEGFLAKEAGMIYATIAMVTDYDCWKVGDHCTTDEIMKVMKTNNTNAQELIVKIIKSFEPINFEKENQYAVVTDPKLISTKNKEILQVLLK